MEKDAKLYNERSKENFQKTSPQFFIWYIEIPFSLWSIKK